MKNHNNYTNVVSDGCFLPSCLLLHLYPSDHQQESPPPHEAAPAEGFFLLKGRGFFPPPAIIDCWETYSHHGHTTIRAEQNGGF